ncbi:MAG: FtsK/SpoIIIE domain-containing protein [Jatrophihabitantaceae bacterium]
MANINIDYSRLIEVATRARFASSDVEGRLAAVRNDLDLLMQESPAFQSALFHDLASELSRSSERTSTSLARLAEALDYVARTFADVDSPAPSPFRLRHSTPESPTIESMVFGASSRSLSVGNVLLEWQRNAGQRPRIPIGISSEPNRSNDETVVLDVARTSGVLVSGASGQGKTELLRTVIAALACVVPPTSASIVIVDGKGGGSFTDLADLPHVVQMTRWFDGKEGDDLLRFLEAELRSRQRVALESRDKSGIGPDLMIVVDELDRGLDSERFIRTLGELARAGRDLRITFVLATQRSDGDLPENLVRAFRDRIVFKSAPTYGSARLNSAVRSLRSRGEALFVSEALPIRFMAARVDAAHVQRELVPAIQDAAYRMRREQLGR